MSQDKDLNAETTSQCKDCDVFQSAEQLIEDWTMPYEDWRWCPKKSQYVGLVESQFDACDEIEKNSHPE